MKEKTTDIRSFSQTYSRTQKIKKQKITNFDLSFLGKIDLNKHTMEKPYFHRIDNGILEIYKDGGLVKINFHHSYMAYEEIKNG